MSRLVYVVPKVVSVFETQHAELPLMTRVLIAVSDFFRTYGVWLLIALVVTAGVAATSGVMGRTRATWTKLQR